MNRIAFGGLAGISALVASLSFAETRGFPDLKLNEFFINSIPTGLNCYVVPESEKTRTGPDQNDEYFKEEYFRGKTSLKLTLEPGTYYVTFFVANQTTSAEWIFGRHALPTLVSWGGRTTKHGSNYVMFKVSKGQTAGTFIGLPFGVSLSSEQIDALYPQGNNFTIADEAGLRNQLNTRGVSSTDTETTIQRLTRGGKAAIPIEPGKAAKLVVELKPGGTWEIYGRDK
jgi:hypothetical protein